MLPGARTLSPQPRRPPQGHSPRPRTVPKPAPSPRAVPRTGKPLRRPRRLQLKVPFGASNKDRFIRPFETDSSICSRQCYSVGSGPSNLKTCAINTALSFKNRNGTPSPTFATFEARFKSSAPPSKGQTKLGPPKTVTMYSNIFDRNNMNTIHPLRSRVPRWEHEKKSIIRGPIKTPRPQLNSATKVKLPPTTMMKHKTVAGDLPNSPNYTKTAWVTKGEQHPICTVRLRDGLYVSTEYKNLNNGVGPEIAPDHYDYERADACVRPGPYHPDSMFKSSTGPAAIFDAPEDWRPDRSSLEDPTKPAPNGTRPVANRDPRSMMQSAIDRFATAPSHCADVFYKVSADGIDRPKPTIIESVFRSKVPRPLPLSNSATHPNNVVGGIGGVSPNRDPGPTATFYTPDWERVNRGRPFTLKDTVHVQESPQFKDRARRFVGPGHAKAPTPFKMKAAPTPVMARTPDAGMPRAKSPPKVRRAKSTGPSGTTLAPTQE